MSPFEPGDPTFSRGLIVTTRSGLLSSGVISHGCVTMHLGDALRVVDSESRELRKRRWKDSGGHPCKGTRATRLLDGRTLSRREVHCRN